jgi:hypothetical protein
MWFPVLPAQSSSSQKPGFYIAILIDQPRVITHMAIQTRDIYHSGESYNHAWSAIGKRKISRLKKNGTPITDKERCRFVGLNDTGR